MRERGYCSESLHVKGVSGICYGISIAVTVHDCLESLGLGKDAVNYLEQITACQRRSASVVQIKDHMRIPFLVFWDDGWTVGHGLLIRFFHLAKVDKGNDKISVGSLVSDVLLLLGNCLLELATVTSLHVFNGAGHVQDFFRNAQDIILEGFGSFVAFSEGEAW
jgi:hypothetical protein